MHRAVLRKADEILSRQSIRIGDHDERPRHNAGNVETPRVQFRGRERAAVLVGYFVRGAGSRLAARRRPVHLVGGEPVIRALRIGRRSLLDFDDPGDRRVRQVIHAPRVASVSDVRRVFVRDADLLDGIDGVMMDVETHLPRAVRSEGVGFVLGLEDVRLLRHGEAFRGIEVHLIPLDVRLPFADTECLRSVCGLQCLYPQALDDVVSVALAVVPREVMHEIVDGRSGFRVVDDGQIVHGVDGI